ncbi:hypothetical protein ACFL2V_04440 [Pseudomonadota bacterium]
MELFKKGGFRRLFTPSPGEVKTGDPETGSSKPPAKLTETSRTPFPEAEPRTGDRGAFQAPEPVGDVVGQIAETARRTMPTLSEIDPTIEDRLSSRSTITDLGICVADDSALKRHLNSYDELLEKGEISTSMSKRTFYEKVAQLRTRFELQRNLVNQATTGHQRENMVDLAYDADVHLDITQLLHEVGIAQMLIFGDWDIESSDEKMTRNLGIAPLDQIEAVMIQFLVDKGLMEVDPPADHRNRATHLHLGWGNGGGAERLRRSPREPFKNSGHTLREYIEEWGYADKLYFSVGDLFKKYARTKEWEKPEVQEFLDILATLLMREIYYRKSEVPNRDDPLQQLPNSIGLLPRILNEIVAYIADSNDKKLGSETRHGTQGLAELHLAGDPRGGVFFGDSEFIHDKQRKVSVPCQRLVQRFIEDPGGTSMVLQRLFKPEFFKDVLAQHINVLPYNFIQGRFEDLDTNFDRSPLFNIVSAHNALSHYSDAKYMRGFLHAIERLRPGGILFLDRFERNYRWISRLKAIQKIEAQVVQKYGDEFRVEIVADNERGLTGLVQKGAPGEKGLEFIGDDEKRRAQLLAAGIELIPTASYQYLRQADFNVGEARAQVIHHIMGELPELGPRRAPRFEQSLRSLHPPMARVMDDAVMQLGVEGATRQILESPDIRKVVTSMREELEQIAEVEGKIGSSQFPLDDLEENPMDLLENSLRGEQERTSSDSKEFLELITDSVRTFETGVQVGKISDSRIRWINESRERRVEDLPRNNGVPSLTELSDVRETLLQRLEVLCQMRVAARMDQRPITLLEFKGCFTNGPMRELLRLLLGDVGWDNYVKVCTADIRDEFESPKNLDLTDFQMFVLGGSLENTYQKSGQQFINNLCVPLLNRVHQGHPLRVFGTCFSHQSLIEAFGKLHNLGRAVTTYQGQLQFGRYPIYLPGQMDYQDTVVREVQHPVYEYLGLNENEQMLTVAFTRSGYTFADKYDGVEGIQAIGHDMTGTPEQCRRIPPIAFDLYGGRAITCQFHPELLLSQKEHREALLEALKKHGEAMQQAARSKTHRPTSRTQPPESIFRNNIDLGYLDGLKTETQWVKRDMGPAFMLGVMNNFASQLLHTPATTS